MKTANTEETDNLYTVKDYAKKTGWTKQWVNNLVLRGSVKIHEIAGVRFIKMTEQETKDLMNSLKRQQVKTKSLTGANK